MVEFTTSRSLVVVALLLVFSTATASASTSTTAWKTCSPPPCTTSASTWFAVNADATVIWSAWSTAGKGFSLVDASMTPVVLSPNLSSGWTVGQALIKVGMYRIAVDSDQMGEGTYTVSTDVSATVTIAAAFVSGSDGPFERSTSFPGAACHDYGLITVGKLPAPYQFTMRQTGDLPAAIQLDDALLQNGNYDVKLSVPNDPMSDSTISVAPNSALFVAPPFPSGAFDETIKLAPPTLGLTLNGEKLPSGLVMPKIIGNDNGVQIAAVGWVGAGLPAITCNGITTTTDCELVLGSTVPGSGIAVTETVTNTSAVDITVKEIDIGCDDFELKNAMQPNVVIKHGEIFPIPLLLKSTVITPYVAYAGQITLTADPPSGTVCKVAAFAQMSPPHVTVQSPPAVSDPADEAVIAYGQVELGLQEVRKITVRNDGGAPLNVVLTAAPCAVDSQCEPDLSEWTSPIGGMVSIDAGQQYSWEVAFAPHTVKTAEIRLFLRSDDGTPIRRFRLTGTGIAAAPIDAVLLLDRSFSMNEPAGLSETKIDALRVAAMVFVDALHPAGATNANKIGIVTFNDTAIPYVLLAPIPDDFKENNLGQSALDGPLKPSGNTGIGGAMKEGGKMLAADPSLPHAMVLLTDGIENVPPWMADESSLLMSDKAINPPLVIYSVALGDNVNKLGLQTLGTAPNGGGYFSTPDDLDGDGSYDLQMFFFKIAMSASGGNLVVDPTRLVFVGGKTQSTVGTVHITSLDRAATIIVFDRPELRSFYTLELVDPQGSVVTTNTVIDGKSVGIQRAEDYAIYQFAFLNGSHAGDWIVRLRPTGRWSRRSVLFKRGAFGKAPDGLVPIGYAASVRSDLRMAVGARPGGKTPEAGVLLTASFTERGQPAVPRSVTVDVRTPSGSEIAGVSLQNNATEGESLSRDGVWSARFMRTAEPGTYSFLFHAQISNRFGEMTSREETRFVVLAPPDVVAPRSVLP